MGAHMKTTVDLTDSLLQAAKRTASREGITLKALLEEGLRRALENRKTDQPFVLPKRSFKGKGLHPDLAGAGWDTIRERAYEDHGG